MPTCHQCGSKVNIFMANWVGHGKCLCGKCTSEKLSEVERHRKEEEKRERTKRDEEGDKKFAELEIKVREMFPDRVVKEFAALEWVRDRGVVGNLLTGIVGKGGAAGAATALAGPIAGTLVFMVDTKPVHASIMVLFENQETALVDASGVTVMVEANRLDIRFAEPQALAIERGFPGILETGRVSIATEFGPKNLLAGKALAAGIQAAPIGRAISEQCSYCGANVEGVGLRTDYLKSVQPESILGHVCLGCGAVSDVKCGQSGISAQGMVKSLLGTWPDYGRSACSRCGKKPYYENAVLVVLRYEAAKIIAAKASRPAVAPPPIRPAPGKGHECVGEDGLA